MNSTSPLDPSCRLDASRLMSNRAVQQQIEELVASGELGRGDPLVVSWFPIFVPAFIQLFRF